MVAYDADSGNFNSIRRAGYVRDNFTKPEVIQRLSGSSALGHVRYSTAGHPAAALRDVQPLFAEFSSGGVAIAHNGNLTNARSLRAELISSGSIFQSSSDTECIVHLMARSQQDQIIDKLKDALTQINGAFSIVAMTRTKMIGLRDPHGVRPLVIGCLGEGYVFASETCALDIVGAEFLREVEPGEVVVATRDGIATGHRIPPQEPRFCVFEHVYFSRPDSTHGGTNVYSVRCRIGEELADEAPVEADLVCPVPDSGTPAAIGYAHRLSLPFGFGVIRSQFIGRTFIEPTDQIRNMGVRLKLNINRSLVEGQRIVLVDDSVVRGTTVRKIASMVREAGAREIHFRVASPPTRWPCFYGVDTPDREQLIASEMNEQDIAKHVGVDSVRFVSIDGLYRACGEAGRSANGTRRFCDACFTGEYPIPLSDSALPDKQPLDIDH